MKKFCLTCLFILLASPAWATTYFLAPASAGGNDANNGTSASTPWLSPNHAVNCGDVIVAAASTAYSAANFTYGKWGTVSCPAGNNVAWLQCAAFDACKINAGSAHAMVVDTNFWGVQGFENTTSGTSSGCFLAVPPNSSTSVHHIIFANNIANGCSGGGFTSFNIGSAGADYVVYVGNIAYNAAFGSGECFQGFAIYQPHKSDSAPGTHMYVAGNFAWANHDPSSCAGSAPTDGEGLIFDTFDGRQGGLPAYDQQAVAYNNMFIGNGGRGFEVFNNQAGSSHAHIYAYQNTSWGNETDTHQIYGPCGEFQFVIAANVTAYGNLAQTTAPTGCNGTPLYDFVVGNGDSSVSINGNMGYSATGTYSTVSNSGAFAYGSNVLGTDPRLASPSVPGAPNCGSASSVPNCMASVVVNFTPTNPAAATYGYHTPLTTNVSDPLFPQWLCNVHLPPGLVTMGCLTGSSSLPAPVTITNVTVQ